MSGARRRARLGFLVALTALVAGCAPAARPQPDVLLITIDTLRADFVHAYGFERASSPAIDALAARGVLFERAIAAASLTAPSHASIMTARFAREHSIGTLNGETRLAGLITLAEQFHDNGYETAAFVSNVVLRRRSGLDRGFDHYDDELDEGEQNRRAYFERVAERTAARALAWLSGRSAERPVFVWLHLQDPHGPYTPPPATLGQLGEVPLRLSRPLELLADNTGQAGIPAYQQLGDERSPAVYAGRYAEELLYADRAVGEVVAAIEARAGERGSVVLLTADHGESMGEFGWYFQHGQATTPDLAHVPFVVVAPGLVPRRIEALVSHVDVAPTLLELAGLPPLIDVSGVSLVPAMRTGAPVPERAIFSDTDGETAIYVRGALTRLGGALAARRPGATLAPTQIQTLDWSEGAPWRVDEVDENALQSLFVYLENSVPLVAAEAMRPEHVEQLRALGYLPPVEMTRPEAAGSSPSPVEQARPDAEGSLSPAAAVEGEPVAGGEGGGAPPR